MSQKMSFADAVAMAKLMAPCKPITLWNTLSARARDGKVIDDFTTMALVTAVVGPAQAAKFVADIKAIYWKGAK